MELLRLLTADARLLFVTRFARLFAYGAVSVILVIYLTGLGLSGSQTGLLLTLTLAGDTAISLWLTTRADRFGRRCTPLIGAALMAAAGLAFALTRNFFFLVVAGTIGVISPSGNEVGPFLSIEQAALSHVIPARSRTHVFAWYTLAGSIATRLGALCAGLGVQAFQNAGVAPLRSERAIVIGYAAIGLLLVALFSRLSTATEVVRAGETQGPKTVLGLGESRGWFCGSQGCSQWTPLAVAS